MGTSQHSGGDRIHDESSNGRPAAKASEEAILPLEKEIVELFDEADQGSAKLSNVKGVQVIGGSVEIINAGITIGDSSGFTSVCGYVEKLMKIGDAISQVSKRQCLPDPYCSYYLIWSQIHPWASLAWSILSALPKVCLHFHS